MGSLEAAVVVGTQAHDPGLSIIFISSQINKYH